MQVAGVPPSQSSATVRTNLSYLVPICLVATLGGLLFGYDTGVISGAIEFLTARFHLDVVMKGWASGCVLIGCATGVLMVGSVSDRFGRKKALLLAAARFLASAIGTALPRDIWTFILFRWLGGIGIASMSTPMFPMMDAKDSWFVQHFNHAFPFYIYAVFCLVVVVVVWSLVPETKGRSLEEIERSWATISG